MSAQNLIVSPPPGLMFDPVDAIISFGLSGYLDGRLSDFALHIAAKSSSRHDSSSILSRFEEDVSWRVPFYANLLPNALNDIPLISKRDLQKSPHLFLARDIKKAWYKETSGTTGAPVRIFYSAEFNFEQRFLDIEKILLLNNMKRTEMGVSCVQLTDTASSNSSIFASPLNPRCLLASLNIGDPRWIDQVAILRPRIVSSRPEIFAQVCDELAKISLSLELLVSAGSALSAERREQLETSLGAKCINVYALSEFGMVAAECCHGALHVDATCVFVEVIGKNQEQLAFGSEGEIVLSSLVNLAQPLLRYRTGDQGTLSEGPCSCGKSGPILRLTGGRKVPTFTFASGATLTPTCFNNLALRWALEDFQVNQIGSNRVEILVQPSSETPKDVLHEISECVQNLLPPGVCFEVRLFSFPATMKRQRYTVKIEDF